MKAMRLTRTTTTVDGREVPALYRRGLAIHREPDGRGYAIRQARSGLRVVGRSFPTLREARVVLARLLELPVDWMADRDEIFRQCKPLMDRIIEAASAPSPRGTQTAEGASHSTGPCAER